MEAAIAQVASFYDIPVPKRAWRERAMWAEMLMLSRKHSKKHLKTHSKAVRIIIEHFYKSP